MENAIQQAHNLGQAIWLDYIRRGSLVSGEFQNYINMGISGVTSNPTIFEKSIIGNTDYDEALQSLIRSNSDTEAIYEIIALDDITKAADMLRPTYDQSNGLHGYVSFEVSPLLAYDTATTINEARRIFTLINRPNIMIKVPATPEGIPAIRTLIGDGINVNVTLLFSIDSYRHAAKAYIAGLEDLYRAKGDPGRVASVASFFVSRIDTAVDLLLDDLVIQGDDAIGVYRGKTAVACAKLVYQSFKEIFSSSRFDVLKAKGARVQRPLWASTGTKNPEYSEVLYVEPLIGPDTVNTLPPATITSFLKRGKASATVEQGAKEAENTLAALAEAGINIKKVTDDLLDEGVRAFIESFKKLLASIESKRKVLLESDHV